MLRELRQARLEKGFLYDRERVICGDMKRLSEYIHGYRFAGLPWMPQILKTTMTYCNYDGFVILSQQVCHKRLRPAGHGVTGTRTFYWSRSR